LQLGNMGFEEMVVYDLNTKKKEPPSPERLGFRREKLGKEKVSYEMANQFTDRSFDKIETTTDAWDQLKSERRGLNVGEEMYTGSTVKYMIGTNGLETFGDDVERPGVSFTEAFENCDNIKIEDEESPTLRKTSFPSKSILKNSPRKIREDTELDPGQAIDLDALNLSLVDRDDSIEKGKVFSSKSILKNSPRKTIEQLDIEQQEVIDLDALGIDVVDEENSVERDQDEKKEDLEEVSSNQKTPKGSSDDSNFFKGLVLTEAGNVENPRNEEKIDEEEPKKVDTTFGIKLWSTGNMHFKSKRYFK